MYITMDMAATNLKIKVILLYFVKSI